METGAMPAMSGMGGGESPSSKACMESLQGMMGAMHRPMTGDGDKDFAAMMIAHHVGAVAMAGVELRYGADPTLRALAGDIVEARKREVAAMREWQGRNR
jgi:uncharacterized protein (DUF305 family)